MNPIAYIAAGVLALLLAAIGVQTWRVHSFQTALSIEQLDRQRERVAATQAALAATAAARAKEQQISTDQAEVTRHGFKIATQSRADAVAVATADQRLRQRTAALAASCRAVPSDSTAAADGAAAASAGDLLADMQRRVTEAARQFAGVADGRGDAGTEAQGLYDALKGTP